MSTKTTSAPFQMTALGVYRTVLGLVVHWTLFTALVLLDVFTYDEVRLLLVPVPLVAALLIAVYNYNRKRGRVEELEHGRKRRYEVALVVAVVVSIAVQVGLYFFA